MSRRLLIVLVVAVGAGIAVASGPGQRAIESTWLLTALGRSAASAGLIPDNVAALRQTITFNVEDRSYAADLYRADDAPRAALLLVPGLAPEGKDDRRLVDLAVVLARADLAVLVPDIASLRAQRVSAENVRQIADALTYLVRARSEILPAPSSPAPVGIAAISYAVGPALLATLEPELHGRIDFMIAIGGYYDVEAVVTYFTTGFYRNGGAWTKGTPNDYGKWLFVSANADAVTDMRDRITLRAMAGRRMADGNADIADLIPLLGPEGRAVHALLANEDPDQARRLIAALPDRLLRNLTALNLRGRDLANAPRSVVLIHGRDDRIIPVSESLELGAALPPGQSHLYVVEQLAHADLEPGDWRDILTLWQATYRLLRLRDGAD
jgi:pimeloyl-ACP methyl ester carboxylesterase